MSNNALKLLIIIPITLVVCGCGNPEKPNPKPDRTSKSQNKSKSTKPLRTKQKPAPANSTPPAQASNSSSQSYQPPPPPRPSNVRDSARYDISLSQIRDLQKEETAVFVDARGPDLYQQSHLSGAINVPAGMQEKYIEKVHQQVRPDELIVVYCSSAMCEAGNTVCDYLRSQGYTNVKVYKPGWAVLSVADVDRSQN